MKVVFHASAGPDLAGRLDRLEGLDVSVCREDDTETLFRLLPECDVLWHVLQRCTAEMIAAAPRLRLIQKIGVGVNTIDLDAARQQDIPVCNLPGTNARAVAELALGLMLSVLRRIPAFDQGLRAGTWTDTALQDGIGELGGRTVGLVGFGAIPRILGTHTDGDGVFGHLYRKPGGARFGWFVSRDGCPLGTGRPRETAPAAGTANRTLHQCRRTEPNEAGGNSDQYRSRRVGRPTGSGHRAGVGPDRRSQP